MADNATVPNVGVVATDKIGGVDYQRVKPAVGADGSATDVSDSNPMPVAGGVAHDAADAGNPIKVGGKASSSAPTAVASGDRVDAYFDTNGRLVINLAGLTSAGQATMANSFPVAIASNQSTITVAVAGKGNWVATNLTTASAVANDLIPSPTSGRSRVIIKNNHASNTLYIGESNSVTTSTGYPLAANGGEISLDLGADAQVWGISSGAAIDARIIELY